MLSGNQLVERTAPVRRRNRHVPFRPGFLEQDEAELAADGLLVPLHRLPSPVPIDLDRLGMQELDHLADVPAGQAKRGEYAERDRLAVGDALVAGGRLERIPARMAEVHHL